MTLSGHIGPSERAIGYQINTLNALLNPIRHLPALLGAHHILHVSRIRVNEMLTGPKGLSECIEERCAVIRYASIVFLSLCAEHCVPSIVFLSLCAEHFVPSIVCRALCAEHCVPSIVCRALCAYHCVPSIVFLSLCADHCVPSIACRELCAEHWVPSTAVRSNLNSRHKLFAGYKEKETEQR